MDHRSHPVHNIRKHVQKNAMALCKLADAMYTIPSTREKSPYLVLLQQVLDTTQVLAEISAGQQHLAVS